MWLLFDGCWWRQIYIIRLLLVTELIKFIDQTLVVFLWCLLFLCFVTCFSCSVSCGCKHSLFSVLFCSFSSDECFSGCEFILLLQSLAQLQAVTQYYQWRLPGKKAQESLASCHMMMMMTSLQAEVKSLEIESESKAEQQLDSWWDDIPSTSALYVFLFRYYKSCYRLRLCFECIFFF